MKPANLMVVLALPAVVVVGCVRRDCNNTEPKTQTPMIRFTLKDRNTNSDILNFSSSPEPVPDSIKLKDLKTGIVYPLLIGKGVNESIIYSSQYNRPAFITDSLLFIFGNSIPDTLIIQTGIVKGWRGDECGYANDAGIIKVMLRNQVVLQSDDDNAYFGLRK